MVSLVNPCFRGKYANTGCHPAPSHTHHDYTSLLVDYTSLTLYRQRVCTETGSATRLARLVLCTFNIISCCGKSMPALAALSERLHSCAALAVIAANAIYEESRNGVIFLERRSHEGLVASLAPPAENRQGRHRAYSVLRDKVADASSAPRHVR